MIEERNHPRHGFDRFINILGESMLTLLLGTLLVLACVQILMRSITGGSLLWIDPLLRYLVLWSGLFGAVMATIRGKHIALDVAAFILPQSSAKTIEFIVFIFSALTTATLSWAAIYFVASEMEYGGPGLLGLPSWQWNLAFPLTFITMTMSYIWQSYISGKQLLHRTVSQQENNIDL